MDVAVNPKRGDKRCKKVTKLGLQKKMPGFIFCQDGEWYVSLI
jgi:hypothetical protein